MLPKIILDNPLNGSLCVTYNSKEEYYLIKFLLQKFGFVKRNTLRTCRSKDVFVVYWEKYSYKICKTEYDLFYYNYEKCSSPIKYTVEDLYNLF